MYEQYQEVERAFDSVAPFYDKILAQSSLNAKMREISLSLLTECFNPGQKVLEMGCGTGGEAIELARRGVHVTATDISNEMVAITRRKVEQLGLGSLVECFRLPAGHLQDLLEKLGPGSYDGAYSSFGALNCEPSLHSVAIDLKELIKPGGYLVISMVNKCCLWELLLFSFLLRFRKAFRRLRTPLSANLYGYGDVKAHLYSLEDVKRILGPYFQLQKALGLLVLLPPPYLESIWNKMAPYLSGMEKMDEILRQTRLFSGLGDHYLVKMKRVGQA